MGDGKKYRFYLATTGEVIHRVTLEENPTDDQIDQIRLKLAYEHGYEANSIDYDEE